MKTLNAIRVLILVSSVFIVALSVYADGPSCTQSGLGPADMMMSNGDMNPKYMWKKSHGRVILPVVLDHAYSHKEREVIYGGLAEMASKTCVKFLVYNHPEEVHESVYISKTKSKGCWSYVGKQGGHQDLSLPVGCINHRTVMHEMMHALGFSHEHVRNDRDKFVEIHWENIQQGRERNFERKRDSKSDNFGPYDYKSIMHYDNKAFSKNGRSTITPSHGFTQIGRGKRMSHLDALKINRAYKCGKGEGEGYGGNEIDFTPEESPPVRFAPEQSFRTNPFFSGPSSSDLNEVDHVDPVDHDDVDFSPFGPSPFYSNHPEHDDYYDH